MEIKSNMDENLSLLPAFQNDYIGMAMECRDMRYRYRSFMDKVFARFSTNEEIEFIQSVIEFENYCEDQEYQMEI